MIIMEHSLYDFMNMILIVACAAMSMVFLAVQLPSDKGIKKYRKSLRFLASAYLIMSVIGLLVLVLDLPVVNLIPMENLIVASLQAPLFTFTLIVLINPQFVTRSYVLKQLYPTAAFIVLYLAVAARWGNPVITNLEELKLQAYHPAVMVREMFLIYYACQLVYLTKVFIRQAKKYETEIDNFFSNSFLLHLPGIQYSFYSALVVGISTLISCFIFTEIATLIFTIVYCLFYVVFGLHYIQYPRIFKDIEQAIYPPIDFNTQPENTQVAWNQLKTEILNERYYLVYGVTIEQMSQYLNTSRATLAYFINSEEGMNFNVWINALRTQSAEELLTEHPDYSLTQIAEVINYGDSPIPSDLRYKLA
jgi:AraC-like DNA-binding protein